MPELFAALDADPDVRAIVITGSGRNFSYGLDVPAMGGRSLPCWPRGARPSARGFPCRDSAHAKRVNSVADCRTPTIASVHGWCIGGGVDLISAVDIRYASADAKFSVREVKLAIVADMGSLARLPLILNDGHLRELATDRQDIDAARAEKIGLVNDVFADADAALAAAHATAAEIAANPPLTVHGVKDVLDQQRASAVRNLRTSPLERRLPAIQGSDRRHLRNVRKAPAAVHRGVGSKLPASPERTRTLAGRALAT